MQQLKKHQGVIFDCDGTLVLTEHIYTRAYQIILTEHGVSLEEKEIKERFSGQSLFTSIEKIEEEFNIIDSNFIEKFDEICCKEKKTDASAICCKESEERYWSVFGEMRDPRNRWRLDELFRESTGPFMRC